VSNEDENVVWFDEDASCALCGMLLDVDDDAKPLQHDCPDARLEKFLSEFPNDARSWANATDEIRDMYFWMASAFNAAAHAGPELQPVGRENCATPAEWNQKYKAAIRVAFKRLGEHPRLLDAFFAQFSGWLS
jgi:hypothetical protein